MVSITAIVIQNKSQSTFEQANDLLRNLLASEPNLKLAVLIGSRATGKSTDNSDWDIALRWDHSLDYMQQLTATERLRNRLAKELSITEEKIDLIDINSARLAMRSVIANEGIPLTGQDMWWFRFLSRTWRELEEHYWEQLYGY